MVILNASLENKFTHKLDQIFLAIKFLSIWNRILEDAVRSKCNKGIYK